MYFDNIFVCFENEKNLKIKTNVEGINIFFFYYRTNKEVSTVLCSVVKHLGSG